MSRSLTRNWAGALLGAIFASPRAAVSNSASSGAPSTEGVCAALGLRGSRPQTHLAARVYRAIAFYVHPGVSAVSLVGDVLQPVHFFLRFWTHALSARDGGRQ